ncbi:MAG: glucosylglycerol 3-phosphatase, partial [Cyanobacteria bacterium P01_H01_bin.15]
NILHHRLNSPEIYLELQSAIAKLIQDLLQAAKNQGLGNSFFVHYAPNLGRDEEGLEILRPATVDDSGTTDFQFMLRGGIKEAGLVALLNRYYFLRTGQYPLGAEFNARQAPHTHEKLLQLVEQNFDPAEMPCIVGVGDTVTSKAVVENGQQTFRRGGSDRNFLQLIQDLNSVFGTGNLVVYVDSSGGELKNRRALGLNPAQDQVLTGPCDPADRSDPLKLNIVFPGGHQQYIQTFTAAAHQRKG